MKILIVSPFYAPFSLVGANRMMSLSAFLANQGHAVTVWAHDVETLRKMTGTASLCSLEPANLKIIRFGLSDNTAWGKLLYPVQYLRQMRDCKSAAEAQLCEGDYDVVLLTCGPLYTQSAIASFTKRINVPLVLDMRDMNVLEGKSTKRNLPIRLAQNIIWYFQQFLPERRCMRLAARVVGVVPAQVAQIKNAYKISEDKISIIYNGFDDSKLGGIKAATRDGSVKKIGFFGKLMYYSPERTVMMLKAVDQLRRDGYDVELFHVGTASPMLMKTITELQLDPRVYYAAGSMDYRDGISNMLACNLMFIEYSDMNGLGTKLFDYIYCNKPIVSISPRKAALSELVDSFENGFVCESAEEAYTTIKSILDSDISVLDTHNNAQKYSRTIQNENYEKLLQSVVDEYKQHA